jgi:hypothetical protein
MTHYQCEVKMNISNSVANKEALTPLSVAISRYVQGLMSQRGIKYTELQSRLAAKGVHYSESNLRNKVTKFMLRADLFFFIVMEIKGDFNIDASLLQELAEAESGKRTL